MLSDLNEGIVIATSTFAEEAAPEVAAVESLEPALVEKKKKEESEE